MKIVVRGVRSQSGFGVATIGLVKLFVKAGYDIRFIPVNVSKNNYTDYHDGIAMDKSLELLNSLTIDITDDFVRNSIFIDVGALIFGYSVITPDNIAKYILYTTTETTTINTFYSECYNLKYDEIWTASKFNKVGYEVSGVTIPVKILPHLVDTDKFNPELKPYKIKNKRSFNFIVNVDFSHRKGLHLLIPAWSQAFNRKDDVSLILKISDGPFSRPDAPINSFNQLLLNLNYNAKTSAPILIIPNMIDEQYLPNLYTTGNVYIAPTLGEGFGFPIAESMACGIPPIVSNCSAPSEYVTKEEGFLIHLTNDIIQPITDDSLLQRDPNYRSRYMYDVSKESLYNNMILAYNTSIDELHKIGASARNKIITNFSYDPLINILNSLLKE